MPCVGRDRAMRPLKIILWIQLVIGLAAGYMALPYVHWGAMSAAWASNLQAEHDKMKQSPEYREPAPIKDQSLGKILDDMQAYGRARADVAGYWLLTCVALVLLAVVGLVVIRRAELANKALHATAATPSS
jgi:hypothetical protein